MNFDVIIIGAGVIGLAIAREISQHGYSVVILDKESSFGQGASSRNSEVVHAGIYYKTGTLKASLSIRGKALLYEFCEKFGIPYKQIGKLFVAVTDDEVTRLELTEKQGLANGLDDLIVLDKHQLRKIEPELSSVAALFSPSTGIFDSHMFMQSLLAISEDNGSIFSPNSLVTGADPIINGWKVFIEENNKDKFSITGRVVINSAGLYATKIAQNIFSDRQIPGLIPTKGCYLKYIGKPPVKHIIYPAIIPGNVEPRVDATPDLNGFIRFGPNVEVPESLNDYKLNENLVNEMKLGIRRYLPSINESLLYPDFAGIRPKISIPGEDNPDFIFDWNEDGNWLDLFGMESPGLTSSLAIAEYVFKLSKENQALY
jgi:L-2-hydroxyglutarate oxidase LhgO